MTSIECYTLVNSHGLKASILAYGGTLISLHAPNREGVFEDIVLGFDDLHSYLGPHPHFGGIIGRFANRIAEGTFQLKGKPVHLPCNKGPNHLHGGAKGFDRVMWQAHLIPSSYGKSLELTYSSPDGEEQYPGKLEVKVTYSLTDQNELRLDYVATTDKTTIINLTNHSYFNLAGKGDVLGHRLTLKAPLFLPVNENLIPTGELKKVGGTPMDFTEPRTMGYGVKNPDDQIRLANGGYDHTFVFKGNTLHEPIACVYEPVSGRTLKVFTTQPGVQFYSGNFLNGTLKGKKGLTYQKHAGFCLETQHFPDSPNQPSFPSVVLDPGQTYEQTTIYQLGVGEN